MGCDRILLVEDDADLLDLMAEVIEQRGTTVVRCRDATSALQRLRTDARPDLVLLDLSLPKISGAELLSMIREKEEWRTLPVAAITGMPRSRYPDLPVDAFVSKPFDAAELESLVARLCGTTSTAATTVA